MRRLLIVVLFLLPMLAVRQVNAQPVSLNKNQIDAIENAHFTDLQGNSFTANQYRGKVVMIDFWETWCGPCIRSMPTNDKLVREFPDKFAVIALAPGMGDSKDKVVAFAKHHNYKFKYAYGGKLAQKLQIVGIPYKVFLSPQGKFIKVVMGSMGEQGDYNQIKGIILKYTGANSGTK